MRLKFSTERHIKIGNPINNNNLLPETIENLRYKVLTRKKKFILYILNKLYLI